MACFYTLGGGDFSGLERLDVVVLVSELDVEPAMTEFATLKRPHRFQELERGVVRVEQVFNRAACLRAKFLVSFSVNEGYSACFRQAHNDKTIRLLLFISL